MQETNPYPPFPLSAIGIVLLLALLAWFFNQWLQRMIQPRQSLSRLFLYFLSVFLVLAGGVYLSGRVIFWVWLRR